MSYRPNHWPKPSPDYHRLVSALQKDGNPTQIPFLELFADREVIAAYFNEPVMSSKACSSDREIFKHFLNRTIKFWYELGYDAVWQWPIVDEPAVSQSTTVDESIYPKEARGWVDHTNGVITSWNDFEKIRWPTPQEVDYWPLEYVASELPTAKAGWLPGSTSLPGCRSKLGSYRLSPGVTSRGSHGRLVQNSVTV